VPACAARIAAHPPAILDRLLSLVRPVYRFAARMLLRVGRQRPTEMFSAIDTAAAIFAEMDGHGHGRQRCRRRLPSCRWTASLSLYGISAISDPRRPPAV